jgi:hypothetical protein
MILEIGMQTVSTPKDRFSRFLGHLDSLFEAEPEFFPFESKLPQAPKIVCMVYRDIPEVGSITGVTYGLSEVHHPDWRLGRPELTITVDSTDSAWPLAMGEVANNLRGQCAFCYGDVINFGEKISNESDMSAFVIFAPSIFERESFLNIDVGSDLTINIAGLYPLYSSERDVIRQFGFERFWHHRNFDPYEVTRSAVEIAPSR